MEDNKPFVEDPAQSLGCAIVRQRESVCVLTVKVPGLKDALGALEDSVGRDSLPVAHVHGIGMAKSHESIQERMVDILR